jgi:hypothetical protein
MFNIDDLKVLGANVGCMVMLGINSINANLQSVLFFSTIIYTIVRTLNEIIRFKDKQDDDTPSS